MRILYVLTTLAVGGAERQVLLIAERMAARGHTVAILTLRPREPEHCVTSLEVATLNMRRNWFDLGRGLHRALKFARTFRPDVIHSHNFHGNVFARLLRLCYRSVGLISTIHNVYEGGRLRMLAYRITDGLADRTTAVSVAVKERFVRLRAVAPEKCIVITNGIDSAEFTPRAERRASMRVEMGVTNQFVWLSVGRLTPAKDPQNLLLAFESVCRSRDDVQLWIAGEPTSQVGSPESGTEIWTQQGARDKIRRLGLRTDIPALLDAADGFVLGSAWEGMPLAVGEAMAMEKPIVATDVGGVRELAGETATLVPARDANALCAAMMATTQRTKEQREAIARAARRRILDYFDIEQKAAEWEALYDAVLAEQRAPFA